MSNISENLELAEQLEKVMFSHEYNQRLQQEIENDKKLTESGLESIKYTPLEQILSCFKQGDTWAAYNLGLMHMHGIKVDKDLNRALQFFEVAQERKHSMAKKMITIVNQQIEKENTVNTELDFKENKERKFKKDAN